MAAPAARRKSRCRLPGSRSAPSSSQTAWFFRFSRPPRRSLPAPQRSVLSERASPGPTLRSRRLPALLTGELNLSRASAHWTIPAAFARFVLAARRFPVVADHVFAVHPAMVVMMHRVRLSGSAGAVLAHARLGAFPGILALRVLIHPPQRFFQCVHYFPPSTR